MNIISCECGVVLDKDKLRFPADLGEGLGGFDVDKAGWDGDDWVAKVQCPVCGADILESA